MTHMYREPWPHLLYSLQVTFKDQGFLRLLMLTANRHKEQVANRHYNLQLAAAEATVVLHAHSQTLVPFACPFDAQEEAPMEAANDAQPTASCKAIRDYVAFSEQETAALWKASEHQVASSQCSLRAGYPRPTTWLEGNAPGVP